MKIGLFFILILISQMVFADVYPTDTFGIHKLCISNPWAATNFKGDATSTFPCHYDYAIVHVPTLLQDLGTQITNTNPVITLGNPIITLEIPKPNFESMMTLMGVFYISTLSFLLTVWGFSIFLKLVFGRHNPF